MKTNGTWDTTWVGKEPTPLEIHEWIRNSPGPTSCTDHGGRPTNDKECATHNFRMGAMYAGHGIQIDELREDWPEVFANKDCMRGFRKTRKARLVV
jgi:hypothetical protein